MKGISIAAPDTDSGKTVCTALLLSYMKRRGVATEVMKPVQTGAVRKNGLLISPDIEFAYDWAEITPPTSPLNTPYLFREPCSPHLAARMEASRVDLGKIIKSAESLQSHSFVIAESAGGVLSPINENETNCDLLKKLNYPVLLVSENRLGTISPTLATIEALRSRDIPILGFILTQKEQISSPRDRKIMDENGPAIEKFSGCPMLGVIPYSPDICSRSSKSILLSETSDIWIRISEMVV